MERNRNSGFAAFIRTPVGIAVAAFLAIAGFLLIAEHRAHILAGDWGIALLLLFSVGAHLLMHRGHGGHGGHHTETNDKSQSREDRGAKGDTR